MPHLVEKLRNLFPGFLIALLVAIAAQFLSNHYGAPAMLMALLLGIALHFLGEEGPAVSGIKFSASTVLRIGIALLGARISVELLADLGWQLILLVIASVCVTLVFGYFGARVLKRGWRFGLLTGGAVAICGASAAIALAAVLPKNEHSERNLIFTIMGVTILSTIAMIAYPPLTELLGLTELQQGIFIGATIHDVAQVVGAGFSISNDTGEIATVVKLMRVALLAPIVLCLALAVRNISSDAEQAQRPPLVPVFILAFLVFAGLNSFHLLPAVVTDLMTQISKWALLTAIAAVGMKTSLKSILNVGGQAIALIVAQTVFLAVFVLSFILLLAP